MKVLLNEILYKFNVKDILKCFFKLLLKNFSRLR